MPTTVANVKRDIGSASSYFTDDEIQEIITANGGIHALSVAHCLEVAASKVLDKGGSISIGKYREDFSSKHSAYLSLARLWRKRFSRAGFTGGISKADNRARKEDSDFKHGLFEIDMFTNTETSQDTTED
jgi:hypothetical protein